MNNISPCQGRSHQIAIKNVAIDELYVFRTSLVFPHIDQHNLVTRCPEAPGQKVSEESATARDHVSHLPLLLFKL
jgi:hypothetical protein